MEDLHRQLEAIANSEGRVVMATVVATRGATPKKEGHRMWVGEGGRALGPATIGGPVDAKVIAESRGVFATGEPRLLRVSLPDEDAWDMGLACGGILDVLVEALELDPRPSPVVLAYRRIASELGRGRAACLVRPLHDPAHFLLVAQDGTTEGSLGDVERDRAAIRLAAQLFPAGLPVTQPIAGEGTEAFFEMHVPRPHLIAVGAGHMSMPLVSLARALGFHTTVVDPRQRFATPERFPDADELRVGDPSRIVAELPLLPSTAVVLTIHDFEVEVPVLRAVVSSEAGYVGMLGSRKRGRGVLETLRQQGVPAEQLARIQVPVGLDIGAQTAARSRARGGSSVRAMRLEKGQLPPAGAVLAQNVPGPDGRVALDKGAVLGAEELQRLSELPWSELHLIALEPGDVHEEEAGRRLAAALAGDGVDVEPLSAGAFPLVARHRGLLEYDPALLARLNEIDDLAVYARPAGSVAGERERIGGAKIIPFVTREERLGAAERIASGGLLRVRRFLPVRVAVLVEDGVEERVLSRARRALEE